MIARYQDGYAFLIEIKGDELGLHVQLGDSSIWKYQLDADFRFSSFCLQYEKLGKSFFWQKFDQQKQFHLTKLGYLESVCGAKGKK